MIKAVCFDLDGVFFTEESFNRFKTSITNLTEYPEIINDVFHGNMMGKFKIGKLSENEYWDYVIATLRVKITKSELFSLLRNSYEINEKIFEVVKSVHSSDFQTCICSNNFETRIRELDSKFNFLNLFDTKIFSCDVGFLKPSINIFQELVHQCNLEPNEILYSDDNEFKLKGATDLGINTFKFSTVEIFIEKLISYNVL